MKDLTFLFIIARRPFLFALTFIFGSHIVISQKDRGSLNDWEKIMIKDSHFGWSSFENDFQIDSHNLWLTPLDKPDSIIKKVDSKLVYELVQLIKKSKDSTFENPLISFGRDSVWLVSNGEKLWKDYIKEKKTKEIDSIAINTIKDYQKANQAASSLQGSKWTDDFPFVIIRVVKEKDTLSIFSDGQYPYMLPWRTKKGKIYDSKISELLSELLPDHFSSNKERLNGKNFNNSLISEINTSFLEDKISYLESRNKFPRTFKSLQKEFEITKAEIMCMSSIEWDGKECLEMYLKDLKGPKNIQFNTITAVNELFSSKKSILSVKRII